MPGSDQSRFLKALDDAIAPWPVRLDDAQRQKLWGHFDYLRERNRIHNLTRIVDPLDAAVQLYADSLAVLAWANASHSSSEEPVSVTGECTLIDVGTGAGFPAFPLAVAAPNRRIIAIDGRSKKVAFLSEAARMTDTSNLTCLHQRAEAWRPDSRADLVTLKAVGPLAKCLDCAKNLVTPGGRVVVFKSLNLPEEEEAAVRSREITDRYAQEPMFRYALDGASQTLTRSLRIYRRTPSS